MKESSIRKQKIRSGIVTAVLIVFVLVLVGFPLLWMAVSSFKPGVELFTVPPKVLPKVWSTEWYKAALPLCISGVLSTGIMAFIMSWKSGKFSYKSFFIHHTVSNLNKIFFVAFHS